VSFFLNFKFNEKIKKIMTVEKLYLILKVICKTRTEENTFKHFKFKKKEN